MSTLKLLFGHYSEIIGAISLVFSGLLAICLLIPGDQPDKILQSIVNILKKFSRK